MIQGSLYFDRDTYCIEKYRKVTKATDLVSCVSWLLRVSPGLASLESCGSPLSSSGMPRSVSVRNMTMRAIYIEVPCA